MGGHFLSDQIRTFASTGLFRVMNLRRYRKYSLSLIVAFLCCTVYAQGQMLILDQKLEPIEAASVTDESGTVWVSNGEGKVQIEKPGIFEVLIQHVSHQSKKVVWNSTKSLKVILEKRTQNLDQVVVEGFTDNDKLSKIAGGIAKISPKDLSRFDQYAVVSTVNTIPGVQFEQRAEASYRVSIRGSSIRSPFGVRNVKVYWNGIPFTEPGGNTFLNLLDLTNISDIEIIKGPAGSAYGAGNGGVIKLRSTDYASLSNATTFSSSIGSFGAFRSSVQTNLLKEKLSLTGKYAFQDVDGFRDHNETKRHVGEIDFLYFANEKKTYSASLLYSDFFYEIPGGLNPTQLEENRRQARPRSEPFNASIDHQFFVARVGQEYEISDRFISDFNAYYSSRNFENPFILDYKRDIEDGFGFRLELENDFRVFGRNSQLTYGTENQFAEVRAKNFGNVGGESDTLRFSDLLENRLSFWFLDAKLNLGQSTKLTVGASLNRLKYNINRLEDEINNSPGLVEKNFESVLSPRVALSHSWNEQFNTHFSISHGYSPPTTTEVRTNEGTLNLGLAPEIGINYELNLRGSLFQNRLSYDIAAFMFNLDESITTETDPQGVVLFRNSGQIDQQGLEASIQWVWLKNSSLNLSRLNSKLAYTYHDFEFKDFVDGGDDLSGNALTGTAPMVINLLTDIEFRNGFYANVTYRFSDRIPLNDQNTVFADEYHLVQTRLGYNFQNKGLEYEAFGGVNNVFDIDYSLGNDLNAFGQRYFQPSPGRNVYFGFKMKINH